MRKTNVAGVVIVLALLLAGCGGGDPEPATVVTQILSDPAVDGFVAEDLQSATLAQPVEAADPGVGFIRVGIDPASGLSGTEYRGFLHFPLGGAGGVPADAVIVSATLEIFVTGVSFHAGSVPVRMDLVDFAPPLVAADYDPEGPGSLPSLLTRSTFRIFPSDAGGEGVLVDVTSLMQEAQRRGLPDFQVRLMLPLDIPGVSGLVTIDDRASVTATAPLLQVEYR